MAFVSKSVIMASNLPAPSGHSQTSVETALVSQQIAEQANLTIAATGIVAATAAAGFDALFTQMIVEIDAFITTTLGINTTANSVDYNCIVQSISLPLTTDIFINDLNRNFAVKALVKIRVY